MRTLLSALLVLTALHSQPTRKFEVASIKAVEGPYGRIAVTTSGTRLTAEASMIRVLIGYAYGVRNSFLVTTPAVVGDMGDIPWDIVAKAEGDAVPSKEEFQQMMRELLADRFRLRAHREIRETPVYALVVSKGGPKFKESAPDASPVGHMSVSGRNNVHHYATITMENLAGQLGDAFLDRPIVDRTGLRGSYEIHLTYTLEMRINRNEPDAGDISLFTAVQEQLGLRLVPQTASIEHLVVDHVERPSVN